MLFYLWQQKIGNQIKSRSIYKKILRKGVETVMNSR